MIIYIDAESEKLATIEIDIRRIAGIHRQEYRRASEFRQGHRLKRNHWLIRRRGYATQSRSLGQTPCRFLRSQLIAKMTGLFAMFLIGRDHPGNRSP